MKVKERVYDLADLWRIVCDSDVHRQFELIEGEIVEMSPPGGEHGFLAGKIFHYFLLFDPQCRLGIPTVDTGYHPPESRDTLLSPDSAFTRIERAPNPFPRTWVPVMPDIAVEVKSPSNTLAELRQKAAIYLSHGSQLVWIIFPGSKSAEVHRLRPDGEIERETIAEDGTLSGEDILPGFTLALSKLFL